MYSVTAFFGYNQLEEKVLAALNYLINQWRYNGQIIGREIALVINEGIIRCNLITPEMDSLFEDNNSPQIAQALSQLKYLGVDFTEFDVNGVDYNSDETSVNFTPEFQILYTTYLDSCSPLRSSHDLGAIPLYTLKNQTLSQKILHWQEDWQACDQLQMNGSVLEQEALFQISEHTSELSQRGLALCTEIERITKIPTYYYLYRLGNNEEEEYNRPCPECTQSWKMEEPLHNIFYFKCDKNRLISNLSWEVQQLK